LDDDFDCEVDNAWGWNYLDRNNITYDDHGHGTSVAGVIAGYNPNNLAFNSSAQDRLAIIPYKYTNSEGKGTVFNAACALRHAADYDDTLQNGSVSKVRVINASWGYYGEPCMVLENTILYSGNNCDLLVVTSAGNDGLNTQNANNKHWPSNSPFVADSTLTYNDNVIAVGALDSADAGSLAFYSNYSPRNIDLAAPGTVQIFNTNDSTNTLYSKSGTSFAAPQVSRIAALLFDEFPDASAAAVKFALLRGVDTLESTDRSLLSSGGRVNYQKARFLLQNMEDRTACIDSFNLLSTLEEKLHKELASVNPNPFSDNISIHLFENNQNADLNVSITDLSGRTLIEKRFEQTENISINTNDLPNGFYFVHLNQGKAYQVTKLVKFK
jgi:subtilisin family serine protease